MKRKTRKLVVILGCVGLVVGLGSCNKEDGGGYGKAAGGSMSSMENKAGPKTEVAKYGFNKAFAILYYHTLAA